MFSAICVILTVGLLLVAQYLTKTPAQSEYQAIPVPVRDHPIASNRSRR